MVGLLARTSAYDTLYVVEREAQEDAAPMVKPLPTIAQEAESEESEPIGVLDALQKGAIRLTSLSKRNSKVTLQRLVLLV
jgi:hypothetical protein